MIDIDEDRLTGEGVRGIDFDDPAWIRRAVDGGLRAQLASESLVTGVRYMALDMRPETRAERVADPTVKYPEIPVLPTPEEQIPAQVNDLVEKLARVDYAGLAESISSLANSADSVARSPELQRAVGRLDDVAGSTSQSYQLRRSAVAQRLA